MQLILRHLHIFNENASEITAIFEHDFDHFEFDLRCLGTFLKLCKLLKHSLNNSESNMNQFEPSNALHLAECLLIEDSSLKHNLAEGLILFRYALNVVTKEQVLD